MEDKMQTEAEFHAEKEEFHREAKELALAKEEWMDEHHSDHTDENGDPDWDKLEDEFLIYWTEKMKQ